MQIGICESLLRLYENNPEYRPALSLLASGQYGDEAISVDDLEDDVDAPRQVVVDLLKKLDELGLGRFIIGRRGYPSRFEWSESIGTAERAALDELKHRVEAPSCSGGEDVSAYGTGNVLDLPRDISALGSQESALLPVSYPLRQNLTVTLNLPRDLTRAEAAKLAGFVKRVYFDDSNEE